MSPHLGGLATIVTFDESTVNAAPQLLDSDVAFTGTDGFFTNQNLTVTGVLAEDTVSVRNQGAGAGQIGLSGSTVSYEGTAIGLLIGLSGSPGADLIIRLNAAASADAVDALIQNLTYSNTSDTPTAERTLFINVSDEAGADLRPVASFAPSTVPDRFAAIDMDSLSAVSFVDLDGDGDLDAVVGGAGRTLTSFRNGDNLISGDFVAWGVDDPFDGIFAGDLLGFNRAPVFVDIDGDDDLDAVVGTRDGTLKVVRNGTVGTQGDFEDVGFALTPLSGIDVGFDSKPAFADLDGDGDMDVVVGASDGELYTFRNGTNGEPGDFTDWGTGDPFALNGNPVDRFDVGFGSAPSFIDLDGDGDLDLVIGDESGAFTVYRNGPTGTAGTFTLWTSGNPFIGLSVTSNATPSFLDLDGDGDAELVTGQSDGTLVTFDNTTPVGQAIQVTVTAQYDAVTLDELAISVTFAENTVNAAPQLLDADISFTNGEGELDGGSLTVAGLLAEDTVAVRNQGTGAGQIGLSGADVSFGGTVFATLAGGAGATLTLTFNAAATPVAVEALIENLTYANSSNSPIASRDLEITVEDASGASQSTFNRFVPWRGTDLFSGIDEGSYSAPSFIDLDGDGDLDAVVGYSDGNIYTFRNGTDTTPGSFSAWDGLDLFSGIDEGRYSAPSFIDLDGDGDLDAVVGAQDGMLYTYRNGTDTTSGSFAAWVGTDPFAGIQVSLYSAPSFIDLDSDGDLDAVVGAQDGMLYTFRNGTDTTSGNFAAWVGPNPFGDIDLGTESAPSFIDLDGDGDLDAVIGSSSSPLVSMRNGTDGTSGVFTLWGQGDPFSGIDAGSYSKPSFVDLDGDGILEAVVGNSSGMLQTFKHAQILTVSVTSEDDGDPVVTGLPSNVTATEDVAFDLNLWGVTLSDPDSSDVIQLALRVNAGELQVTDGGAVLLAGAGLLLQGTAAEITSIFGAYGFRYLGAPDAFGDGAATFTVIAEDGYGEVTLATINIDITPVIDVLNGTDAANTLDGTVGDDSIFGFAGDDTIYGNDGNDTIDGGADDDLISGGTGADNLNGGAGDFDALDYSTDTAGVAIRLWNNTASGGDAQGDTISGFENVTGGSGNDTINGDNGANVLAGGGGNDFLFAVGGADSVLGGTGNDTLYGGESDDTLSGADDNDVIYGDAGADVLAGGAGNDLLSYAADTTGVAVRLWNNTASGGLAAGDRISGFENVTGGSGNDTINGDNGANVLIGRGGHDFLFALGGNDSLMGEAGNDTIYGGSGNDTVNGGSGADDLRGEADVDLLSYAGDTVGVAVRLWNNTASGGDAQGDRISGFENVTGGSGNDTINGDNGANVLTGGGGNDFLFALGGADSVLGGTGNDTLFVSNAGDVNQIVADEIYDGGDDTDSLLIELVGNKDGGFYFDGSVMTGIERLEYRLHADYTGVGAQVSFTATQFASFDEFIVGAHDSYWETYVYGAQTLDLSGLVLSGAGLNGASDIFQIVAAAENAAITGSAMNERILGAAGADSLDGGAGDDVIDGGENNDRLIGGLGRDTVRGGAGDDTLIVIGVGSVDDTVADEIYDGGDDIDTLLIDSAGGNFYFSFENSEITDIERLEYTENAGYAGQGTTIVFTATQFANFDEFIVNAHSGSWLTQIFYAQTLDLSGLVLSGTGVNGANDSFRIWANEGNAAITGSALNEEIIGNAGADSLDGGGGDDNLWRLFNFVGYTEEVSDQETLRGGAGNDTIWVTNGAANQVAAGSIFDGGADTDILAVHASRAGGTEYDFRSSSVTALETLYYGIYNPGLFDMTVKFTADQFAFDTFRITSHAGVSWITEVHGASALDLSGLVLTGDGVNTVGDVFAIFGSSGANSIIGSALNESIVGGAEADNIDGGGGNDTISGGTGADSLTGGVGGFDTLDYSADTVGVAVRLWNHTASGGDAAGDVISGFENVTGGSGNDTINGDNGANVLLGGGGHDFLFALGGSDSILGGSGNDTIYGGSGNDTVSGGSGADDLRGETGVDLLSYAGDTVGVAVRLWNHTASGGDAAGDVISGFENVTGGSGNDTINGDNGANVLMGGGGHDFLFALGGSDSILGGSGNDTIYGGSGQDVIGGGDGNDNLYGGGGADAFVIEASSGADRVFDFEVGIDTLSLSTVLTSGAIDALDVISTFASDASGTVVFDFGGGNSVALVGVSSIANLDLDLAFF